MSESLPPRGFWTNRVKGVGSIVTGVGKQMVFFDYKKKKFVIDVQMPIGRPNFQIEGLDAVELGEDYDKKYAIASTSRTKVGALMGRGRKTMKGRSRNNRKTRRN